MALGKNLIAAALFACLVIASANKNKPISPPFLYHEGVEFNYDYIAEVKAGLLDPVEFDSKYILRAILKIVRRNDHSISMTLQNATIGIKFGKSEESNDSIFYIPVPEEANVIEETFIAHFSEPGQMKGIQFSDKESAWSKNMKKALASLFGFNENISLESPEKTQAYMTVEKTLYGECETSNDVRAQYPGFNYTGIFEIIKFFSPAKCSKFNPQFFDYHMDKPDESVNTASIRKYEIKKKEDNTFVLQKINSFGETNFFPFSNKKMDSYHVTTNVTITLKEVVACNESSVPEFKNNDTAPIIEDLSYQPSNTYYAEGAALDATNGRHVVDPEYVVSTVEQMLYDAESYIEEDAIIAKELNWQRSKIFNKILDVLSFADVSVFEKIYSKFENNTSHNAARAIFLGVLPQVGTIASSLFSWKLVETKLVSDIEAMEILTKLAVNLRFLSKATVEKFEPMINENEFLSPAVRKAAILSFSTLISRTDGCPEKYVKLFWDRFSNQTEYEYHLVYMTALSNFHSEVILEYLVPIALGEVKISQDPEYIQLMALWAIHLPLAKNYIYGYRVYEIILSNYNNPLSHRIAAYEYLLYNAPSMTDMLRIHWFMVYEKNAHLYNYHYTSIKNLASSNYPIKPELKEFAIKILRISRVPSASSDSASFTHTYEVINQIGNGFKFRFSIIFNEETNIPEQIYAGQDLYEGKKPVGNWGFYMNIRGMDDILKFLTPNNIFEMKDNINGAIMLELLQKLPAAIAELPDSHIEVALFYRFRTIFANCYNSKSWTNMKNEVEHIMKSYVLPSTATTSNDVNQFTSDYMYLHRNYGQSFFTDVGVTLVLYARSPFVYHLKIFNNRSEESNSTETEFEVKVWMIHDYSVSIYNSIVDTWHAAGQTSMVVAEASFQNVIQSNPAFEYLRMTTQNNMESKFKGAKVVMANKNSVTVENYNKKSLPQFSNYYNKNVIATKGLNQTRNSPITLNHSNGMKWEFGTFECENLKDGFSKENFEQSLENFKNYQFIFSPISMKLSNCANYVKVEPSNKVPFFGIEMLYQLDGIKM